MSKAQQLIYGINPIELLLQYSPERILSIFVNDSPKKNPRIENICEQARASNVSIEVVNKTKFNTWFGEQVHQNIAAQISRTGIASKQYAQEKLQALSEADTQDPSCILVLEKIVDPQNMGACLRVAHAAGVDLVITSSNSGVSWSPTVCKASSGASEFIPWLEVSNFKNNIKKLQQNGFWVVGTSDHNSSNNLYAQDMTGKLILVMGAEGSGLSDSVMQMCDFMVKIPMLGVVSSLNVATATAVCLYERVRQLGL